MNIKELYIKAFGRFEDRKIVFGDGLNIVYGLNEKGKSTIHRFIEAMLFGFAKPGVKRRVLMEEYDLYRPWTGSLYGGSMVYQAGGRLYKVERDLAKDREDVRVFDHISGQEITQRFAYDKARKELLFAHQHLGLSQTLFRNTISICQMGNKSDAELAREIQTHITNLSASGDIGLSVSKAEKVIREYLDGIGTDRSFSREYGRLCRQVGELEEGLGASAAAVEDLRSLEQQLMEAETRAEELMASRAGLEREIKSHEDSLLLGRWADIQKLKEEQQTLASQLEELGDFSGFETGESQELFTLDRLAGQIRGEIMQTRARIEEASFDIDEMARQISNIISREWGRGHSPDYYRKKLTGSNFLCILSVAGVLGSIVAGALGNSYVFGMIIPWMILFAYSLKRAAKYRGLIREQERAVEKLELEQQYIKKYRDDLYRTLDGKEEELKKQEEMIRIMLDGSGTGSIEEYRNKLMGYEKYMQLQSRLDEIERLLEIKLDGEDYDELRARAKSIDIMTEMPPGRIFRENMDKLRRELEAIKESQSSLTGSIQKTRGSIEILQQGLADLPGMEEELSKARERLEQLQKERAAAQIALEVLHEASSEVHREFAPMLNRRVGEIIAQITQGRYNDMRITGDLEIFATAPETGRQVKAELLSGGTVDQFYFACRMAASDLLSGDKNLPLFLDDSFVQYDIKRLEGVMDYLISVSEGRQIIIFTCHNREREVADRLGGVYNYLEIE